MARAGAVRSHPPRLLHPNRKQIELRASDLESLLGEEHRARLVWGSDWPHTGLAEAALPPYASLLEPLRAALGEAALTPILRDNAHALYFND